MATRGQGGLARPLLGTHRPGIVATPKVRGKPLTGAGGEAQLRCGTPVSAVVNLAATAMGAGVLTLPYAFARCGPARCLALLAVLALATDLSLGLLLRSGRALGLQSLSGLVRALFGPLGSWSFQILLVAILFLALSALQRIVLDVIPMVLEEALGLAPGALPPAPVGAAVNLAVLVACLSKSFHGLRFTSGAALLCLLPFVAVLLGKASARVLEGGEAPPPLEAPANLLVALSEAPPLLASALLCHFSLLDLDAEMQPRYRDHTFGVIHTVSLVILPVTYSLVALAGVSIFGAGTADNVLTGFHGDRAMQLARCVLSLTNIFRMPLMVKPLYKTVTEAVFGTAEEEEDADNPSSSSSTLWRACGTLTLLLLSLATASQMRLLTRIMGLLGGTAGVLGCFCLPGAMYLELHRSQRLKASAAPGQTAAAVFVIAVGCFVVVTCLL